MRARIAEAKPETGGPEAKVGPGRMQDIELLAQAAALLAGTADRDVGAQLDAGQRIGWLSDDDTATLKDTYAMLRSFQSAARLLTGTALDFSAVGEGGRGFLLRQMDIESVEDLDRALTRRAARAAVIIEAALARTPED